MERYLFFDPSRVPPGLHVIGVPSPQGFVWLEITEAEYRAATEDLEAAHGLITYAAEVIGRDSPKRGNADANREREGRRKAAKASIAGELFSRSRERSG